MPSEVMKPEPRVVQPALPGAGPTLLDIIQAVVCNPDVDITKLEKLLEIQERIRADEAKALYNAAMAACQNELPAIVRDARNESTNSMYARLETIVETCKPIIARHGFAVSFGDGEPRVAGNVCIKCEVMHAAGHTKVTQLEAPPDTTGPKGAPTKTPVQGMVSTSSYLKRVLFCMSFNMAIKNADKDGQRHSGFVTEQQVNAILALLEHYGKKAPAAQSKFLEKMGAKTLGELPASRFQEGVTLLQDAVRIMQQGKASEVAEVASLPDAVEEVKGKRLRCKGKLWEVQDDGEQHRWKEIKA